MIKARQKHLSFHLVLKRVVNPCPDAIFNAILKFCSTKQLFTRLQYAMYVELNETR